MRRAPQLGLKAPALATERHQLFMPAGIALDAQESVFEAACAQQRHPCRDAASHEHREGMARTAWGAETKLFVQFLEVGTGHDLRRGLFFWEAKARWTLRR